MPGTVQLAQVNLVGISVGFLPYGKAGGNLLIDQLIQLLQFQSFLADTGGFHTASNIHAYQVRHYLVRNGHGGTDGTAFAGVNVRH